MFTGWSDSTPPAPIALSISRHSAVACTTRAIRGGRDGQIGSSGREEGNEIAGGGRVARRSGKGGRECAAGRKGVLERSVRPRTSLGGRRLGSGVWSGESWEQARGGQRAANGGPSASQKPRTLPTPYVSHAFAARSGRESPVREHARWTALAESSGEHCSWRRGTPWSAVPPSASGQVRPRLGETRRRVR